MTRQVLIINVTRMGDLIQTSPLLSRLREEWPDVSIDLVVDRSFTDSDRLSVAISPDSSMTAARNPRAS
jgi:ADP-heptose:LPS heptosyltransferase